MSEQSQRVIRHVDRRSVLAMGAGMLGAGWYGYGPEVRSSESRLADNHPWTEEHLAIAASVAAAVYPQSVEIDSSFIEDHVFNRFEPSPGHFAGFITAAEQLDRFARARVGSSISALSATQCRRVLTRAGVPNVHPNPDGTLPERVRFFVINDLFYALFTSPRGGELLGITNPPGHPGGLEPYQAGGGDD